MKIIRTYMNSMILLFMLSHINIPLATSILMTIFFVVLLTRSSSGFKLQHVTLSHLRSKEITSIHKPCIPHSNDSMATLLQLNVKRFTFRCSLGKLCIIKHAQYFDLRVKSFIIVDHNHRSLYRHPNSRSIVLNVLSLSQVLTKALYYSLSNLLIICKAYSYIRGSTFEVRCARVTIIKCMLNDRA